MRIVSYNVRYFGHALKGLASTAKSKSRIAAAFASLNPLPDVICLQEIETSSIRSGVAHRKGAKGETQLQAFMRHLGNQFQSAGLVMPYQPAYFPAHTYAVGAVKLYTTGLAVLVNAQTLQVIADNRAQPHPITHFSKGTMKRVKQTRICAHLHLQDTRGRKFHVFNTHLSLPSVFRSDFWKAGPKMGHAPNQLQEAQTVVEFARQQSGKEPFIVCGDFNSLPASPVYRYLTEQAQLFGAQEVLKQIDPKNPRSFATAGFMRLRMHLDHLFGGPGVEWGNLDGTTKFGEASPFKGLSDHVPLIASFDLRATA